MSNDRPPIRVRFTFNIETGEMEMIVDDNAPHLSEEFHDKVAHAIARHLGRDPDIEDAGPRHLLDRDRPTPRPSEGRREETDEGGTLTD